jgi:hypothetical protein
VGATILFPYFNQLFGIVPLPRSVDQPARLLATMASIFAFVCAYPFVSNADRSKDARGPGPGMTAVLVFGLGCLLLWLLVAGELPRTPPRPLSDGEYLFVYISMFAAFSFAFTAIGAEVYFRDNR